MQRSLRLPPAWQEIVIQLKFVGKRILIFQYPLQLPGRFKTAFRSNILYCIFGIIEHGSGIFFS